MGLETYCFAWEKGAVCKDVVDHFIPISITEKEEIVRRCRQIGVDGVVSNASNITAEVASYVAGSLGFPCTPYETMCKIKDKAYVRGITNSISGLYPVRVREGRVRDLLREIPRPFVLKPVSGGGKRGVNFIDTDTVPDESLLASDEPFVAEEYIRGQEYSVESLSFRGETDVIQITEKVGTGAPHFAEMEHHQPACISQRAETKIRKIVPQILSSIGFTNGASHTEIKIDENDNIYLVEVNPRGGGDQISNVLTSLSTDFDYLRGMIEVALGEYKSRPIHNVAYAGIYYLAKQSERLLPWFDKDEEWMWEKKTDGRDLIVTSNNWERNGYIIYKSDKKITI